MLARERAWAVGGAAPLERKEMKAHHRMPRRHEGQRRERLHDDAGRVDLERITTLLTEEYDPRRPRDAVEPNHDQGERTRGHLTSGNRYRSRLRHERRYADRSADC